MRTALMSAATLLVFGIGCEANKDAASSKTSTANPAAGAKGPSSAPATPPAAKSGNPHGGFDKAPPGTPFSGLIKLADGLTEDVLKPTDVLFIMARESQGGGKAGRLVAVKRLGLSKYPLRYEMSAKDVMVPGIPFTGPFIIMARLDRDGDPMTRGEDDLYAAVAQPVLPGQEGVHLVLKKGAPKTMKAPPGVKAPTQAPGRGPASKPAK